MRRHTERELILYLTPQLALPCIATIVSLIPLFPTALRPLAPSFHNLAISLLADGSSPALSDAGAQLFVSLYLLAPKGKDGLREAWKTGVEALVGSVNQLATHVVGGIFAEGERQLSQGALTTGSGIDPHLAAITYNHGLSPLAMPALPTPDAHLALSRLETLNRVLLLALRTPTTEKAGPVAVPLGALLELGVRLAAFSTATPVKERTDPTLRTATYALLPRLQIQGCQLLAQLALATTSQLATHATTILSTLAKTLTTYDVRSPMRPAISTAYAIVLQGLGAAVDPEEGKKSLARVWRTVLEDIGAVALEPLVISQSTGESKTGGAGGSGSGGNSRRAKRQRMYDPSESMAQRRVALDDGDLEIARRGLQSESDALCRPVQLTTADAPSLRNPRSSRASRPLPARAFFAACVAARDVSHASVPQSLPLVLPDASACLDIDVVLPFDIGQPRARHRPPIACVPSRGRLGVAGSPRTELWRERVGRKGRRGVAPCGERQRRSRPPRRAERSRSFRFGHSPDRTASAAELGLYPDSPRAKGGVRRR